MTEVVAVDGSLYLLKKPLTGLIKLADKELLDLYGELSEFVYLEDCDYCVTMSMEGQVLVFEIVDNDVYVHLLPSYIKTISVSHVKNFDGRYGRDGQPRLLFIDNPTTYAVKFSGDTDALIEEYLTKDLFGIPTLREIAMLHPQPYAPFDNITIQYFRVDGKIYTLMDDYFIESVWMGVSN
jgi:hypothetical protein